jgi:serine/threonine protein kinase
MHSINIVHGDIKPGNIMYSKTLNKNVLIDFGTTEFIKE